MSIGHQFVLLTGSDSGRLLLGQERGRCTGVTGSELPEKSDQGNMEGITNVAYAGFFFGFYLAQNLQCSQRLSVFSF